MAKVFENDEGQLSAANCVAYWTDPGPGGMTQAKLLFDPWSPIEGSYTNHAHRQTERVEHIHDNAVAGNFLHSDMPDFGGGTVYLFGRGPSLTANADILKHRDAPAIFLNHSTGLLRPCQGDFVMLIDPQSEVPYVSKDVSLIATPAMPRSVVEAGWGHIFGVNMREPAPINDWAKRLFPNLPLVSECLSVAVSAIHYAALCGANRLVCCGMDFCCYSVQETFDESLDTIGLGGEVVASEPHYKWTAMACAFMAMFALKHTGMETVNASGRGLFGVNVHENKGNLFDWVEQADIKSLSKQN
jgi:hypothetical protein